MATPDQIRRRGRRSLVLGTFIAALMLAAVAYADNFQNDVVIGGNDTITAGGSTIISYRLVANAANGDITGCNVDSSNKATVTITAPAGVTATPASFQFEVCGNPGAKSVTFSSSSVGSHSITHAITGGKTGALYNNQANWTLVVTAGANEDPTADAGGPYIGNEGSSVLLDGTGSSDDSGIASSSWTITPQSGGANDPDSGASCSFVDGTSSTDAQPKVSCTDNGIYDVELTVEDDDAAADEDSTTLMLANADPSATPDVPPGNVNEGSSFELKLTGPTDPGSNDTFTYQFDCGDGDGYDTAGSTPSRTCPTSDNGSRSVKLKILDDDGGSAEYTGAVTVVNVQPTVVASFTAVSVDCRTTATLTIDPDDVGVNDSPWKVNIVWGDGNTEPEITRTNLDSFTVTHVYALPGAYNATVAVTDKDNGTGSDLTNGVTINQTYTVDFLPPFDDSSPSGLIVNKMKNGRVVPVKATIFDDCVGALVTDPGADVTIRVSKTSGSVGSSDPVDEYADAGQSSAGTDEFRWSTDGFWIYNLDSKALGLVVNNLYRVDIYIGAVKATASNWAVLQPVK